MYSNDDEIHFHKITQQINIISESSGYTKKVICKGRFLNKLDKSISIISDELEKVKNFSKIDFISDKPIANGLTINQYAIPTETFYDDLKAYSIQYQDTSMNFGLQYEITCKHLILLSTFPLADYPIVDTLVYEIKSPLNYFLKLKPDTSYHFYTIDTIFSNSNFKTYKIISIPKSKLEPKKSFQSMYEINGTLIPSIRAIVISSGGNNEWKYFNNWFNDLIKDNIKLKPQSLKVFNTIVNENENEEVIIKKVFEYINTNIKYVAIENGLEGFRPRDVNTILYNKYGDCKDMANVLCQVLKNYKLDANIAIIGTIDYHFKVDFPCLASANHAICVVKTKTGKTFYLDATDKTGVYYLPSQFIQGQPYLAFNDHGGEKNQVPVVNLDRNKSITTFNLAVNKSSLSGMVNANYLNYSGSIIKHYIRNSTESDAKSSINKVYSQINVATKFNNIKANIQDSLVQLNADIIANNVVSKIDNKQFLLLKFLIFPHQYPKKIKKNFRFVTYQTNNSQYTYEIKFDHDIKIISSFINFNKQNETTSFELTYKLKDKRTLIIDYFYKINKVELNELEIDSYEKLNEDIVRLFNTSIEYEILE